MADDVHEQIVQTAAENPDATQAEIADEVGVSRSTVSRHLSDSGDEPQVVQVQHPIGNATNPASRRDVDGVPGGFVDVVDGEHKGRFAHFVQVLSEKAGVPERILVRTRDAANELLEVAFEHVRPSERNGGR